MSKPKLEEKLHRLQKQVSATIKANSGPPKRYRIDGWEVSKEQFDKWRKQNPMVPIFITNQ